MPKYKILSTVNILSGVLYMYLLVLSFKALTSLFNISSLSFTALYKESPLLLYLGALTINIIIIYQLLIKKNHKQLPLYTRLSVFTVFLFLYIFISAFFVASNLFLIAALAIIIGWYIIFSKVSTKAAIFIAIFTLISTFLIIASGFEEAYCWAQGDKAAGGNGNAVVTATKEDAQSLKEFNVTVGQQIGKSFRTHMLCHQSFNFTQALQETYLSKN